jgi:poly(beta-D-mannuronate) C5 epimerase
MLRFLGRFSPLLIVLVLVLGAGAFYILKERFFYFEKPSKWPLAGRGYVVRPVEAIPSLSIPPLPDVSGYTPEAVVAKIPALSSGAVRVSSMTHGMGFGKFTESANLPDFIRLQGRPDPLGIHISSGAYDLESLRQVVNDPAILAREGDVWTLSLPIDIGAGASLTIAGTPEKPAVLRLSGTTGAFIANSGLLVIADAQVFAWDASAGVPMVYDGDPDRFRPFLALWSGSRSYMARSGFYHLGYHGSKAYGISFSTDKAMMKADPSLPAPRGWIVACHFEGLYYGFYSYEAEDVAIVGNVYKENIIYGIDPHDRSRRLIIAENEAYGTKKKHGIIVSREVDDSWIFNNYSHNNHGSGFMLDRTSVRNVVAYNRAYRNEADGMTLFESQDNVVYGNKLIANGKNGLRVRNSWNVVAFDNTIMLNGGNGVQVYTQNLEEHEKDRDFELDPFTQRASLDFSGGTVALNSAGGIKTSGTEYLKFSGIEFLVFKPTFLRGDLNDSAREIVRGMVANPNGVEIRMTSDWTPPAPDLTDSPEPSESDSEDSEP